MGDHGFKAGDVARISSGYSFYHIRNHSVSLLPLEDEPAPLLYSPLDDVARYEAEKGELVRLLRPFGENDYRWLITPVDTDASCYATDMHVSRLTKLSYLEQLALSSFDQ